jgi:hypothetical protein
LKTKLGEAKERFGTKETHKGKNFVRGRCSHFGGPEDPRAGSKTDLTDESVASLSDFDFFCAMRWNFKGNKEFWMNQPILIVNPNNEKAVVVRAIDWGPDIKTERTIDVSKTTLSELGADTDDNLLVSFVDQAKWDGFFGPVEVDEDDDDDAQVPDSPDKVKLPGRDDIRDLILSRFASAGFGQIQQIAALANAMRESELDPKARNKTTKEDSVGLFQLNRKGGLGTGKTVSFLKNPNNNIDLILSAANRVPAFGLATTLAKAVSIFVHAIERPADKVGETKKRLKIAENLFDLL